MARTVKHFSLHRIAGTELRVVSDVEAGVLPLIQIEEAVIRGYAQRGIWHHRWVTLFVLHNLQPLVRQLRPGTDLPPGEAATLDSRPVVNVYDLANPEGCHVFVNQQAMMKAGYWDDSLALKGLLAHEHAHPLAENETTRVSRQMQLELSLADSGRQAADSSQQPTASSFQPRIHPLLTVLAEKICLYAPREIFANETTIQSGFGGDLLHLDRRNVTDARRSVAGREGLCNQLQQEVVQGKLSRTMADALLLIGDLKGYLDLALETAPFYRTGRESDARELEVVLETAVFPVLEPQVGRAYTDLCRQYITLRADMKPPELVAWGEEVLSILTKALAEKGLILQVHLQMAERNTERNHA
jgi:hypothetical protein